MVYLTACLLCQARRAVYSKHSWIDSLRGFVKGGAGGTGLPQVGGLGGRGGDVYVEACKKAS